MEEKNNQQELLENIAELKVESETLIEKYDELEEQCDELMKKCDEALNS